ncbi:MAG: MerR family DNA-binding transcriptional regulator [Ectothiorhodospiraceae bacterium]|nr:MerR family DNA-binding transcriptional regulator [Ectothiorhodospiraceae bacterium]MCH8504696.1 MerR family DNA-binding transcriptional regulator [Ectothiorhodospiraceae bacterium]
MQGETQQDSQEAAAKGKTYTIGELAREFGVTTRSIRFWEGEGLLSPIRVGSRRLYRRRDRARMKLILRGKRLGFTLSEIRETFVLYDQAHGEAKQLRYYLGVLDEKRQQLIRQQQDLNDALNELEQSYSYCRQLLADQEQRKERRVQDA